MVITFRKASAALAIAGALSACGAGVLRASSSGGSAGLADGAGPVVGDEALYAMTLPAGWSKVSSEDGQPQIVRYENAGGRWFEVIAFNDTDPFGSEFATDSIWALAYNAQRDGFRIVDVGTPCDPSEEGGQGYCTVGNGRYEG